MKSQSKSTSNRKRWEASDIVKRDRDVNEALVLQNTERVLTRNQAKLMTKNLMLLQIEDYTGKQEKENLLQAALDPE